MKVIFLTHFSNQGHRFRVEQYFPFLTAQGEEPSWWPFSGTFRQGLSFSRDLPSYDVVCIQRRLFSPLEFRHIRKQSRKMLLDLDDAIMYRSSGSWMFYSFSRWLKFRQMVKGVDAVTAGNRFLKEEVLKVDPGKEVVLIPPCIDTCFYPKKKESFGSAEFILGWIGTKGNLKYLRKLEPVLKRIGQQFPRVRLKIVSNDFFESSALPVVKKAWRLEDENEDLVSFDVGLMPLEDDLWSKGKCGIKILQYLSVGVPVVCSPVGINRDIVRDGENGFWARTEEEWIGRLSRLIQDQELRKGMGLKGIETVERAYSLPVTAEKFLKVLHKLMEIRR